MTGGRVMVARHAQTLRNAEKRYLGREDSPISTLGHAQLEWLARHVGEFGPAVAYVSPLGRTTKTLAAVADGCIPTVMPQLMEIDFGEAEGRSAAELDALGIELAYDGDGAVAPGGESMAAFRERVREAADVIASGPSQALVVTHGGVMRELLGFWLELPSRSAWRLALPNCVAAVVRFEDGVPVLESLVGPGELRLGPSCATIAEP